MNFLPASYLIIIGAMGLLRILSYGLLLLSCGKLHRLEGASVWRVAWFCILIEAVLICISIAVGLGMVFSIGSTTSLNDHIDILTVIAQVVSVISSIAKAVGLIALVVALAQPLRKRLNEKVEPVG